MNYQNAFSFWEQLAKGISGQFGPNCEVSIHDLTGNTEHTIMIIENGHVTGRKAGDGPSRAVLEALRKNPNELQDRISYLTQTDDGRTLKSTSLYIRNDAGQVTHLFGINYDITNLIMMETSIKNILDISPNTHDLPTRINKNVNDLLDELIAQSVQVVGKPVSQMTREDKIKAIQFLNNSGAFLITKSGDKVSKFYGISKFTLYNYLSEE